MRALIVPLELLRLAGFAVPIQSPVDQSSDRASRSCARWRTYMEHYQLPSLPFHDVDRSFRFGSEAVLQS